MKKEYKVSQDNLVSACNAIKSITNKYAMFKIEETVSSNIASSTDLLDSTRTCKSSFIYTEMVTDGDKSYIRMVGNVSLGNGYTVIRPGSSILFTRNKIVITTGTAYHNHEDIDNPLCEITTTTFIKNPFKRVKNLDECINTRIHELQHMDIRLKNFESEGVSWKEE